MEFLEQQPAHLRAFYAAIAEALPPQYRLSSSGIAHRAPMGSRALPFCSPFRVKALVEEPKSKTWSRVIELLNPRGELVECLLTEGTLTGRPRDAIAKLSDRGLQVSNDYQIKTILELIRTWPVPTEAYRTLITKVGWSPARDAFTLTSGRILTRKGAAAAYQFGGDPVGEEIGSLETWRAHIAALATGNTNLVFAICLGLSTPLLASTDLGTLIYHFFGKTSRGKTRLLQTAMTVWPKLWGKEKTWAGTINGLEGEIAKSHSILLGLDELRSDGTPDLQAVIYRFANGTSKAKGRKEGGALDREDWCTAVISNGEDPFVDVLSQLGGIPTGGQGVRMLDIPATGRWGIFDNLHGAETSDDFVDHLDRAIKKSWGAAGAAFVERLLERDVETLEEEVAADMRRHRKALQAHLDIRDGDEATTEIRRVLRSFALVATAGEWATDWGLTGWDTGEAYAAVQTIAERWVKGRGRLPFDQIQTLKKVRRYLEKNEHRFTPLSTVQRKGGGGYGDQTEFRDDTSFYLRPAALTTMAEDLGISKTSQILEALSAGGYLESGGEKNSQQFKMPLIGSERPRAYRIRRTILTYDGDDDTSPTHPKDPEE
ncbi:MAG: DUF927 domain-containing protein [Alphaproteobacteria bacterium]|nr:DUF927 domain-containing protein [Alphaproteobacteria bacterium]